MDIREIESYFPSFFSPLETLLYHSNDKIISYRCSAFPFFFKSYEELVNTVDNLTREEKQKIRKSFLQFMIEITQDKKVFYRKMNSNKVELLKDIDENTVIKFSEKCGFDFYFPEISTVFIGHDDYGFILVTLKENLKTLSSLKSMILKNSLFLLDNK